LECGEYGKKRRRKKMLESVKEIGDIVLKKEVSHPIESLLEDPNANGNYKNVFCIVFEEKDGEIIYMGLENEEYDSSKKVRYLYRSGPANSYNFSPSAKVTEFKEKTFPIKILKWFEEAPKKLKLSEEDESFLKKVHSQLIENQEDIISEFESLRKEIPRKEGIFITLKFIKDGKIEYIGDKEIFIKALEELVKINEGRKGSNIGVCSICHEEKDVSTGDGVYTFFTIDKPGFIAGGFEEKEAWKNFPICSDCRRSLEKGKEYIETNLTFKMAGISYQLIPKFLLGKEFVKEEIYNILFDTPKLISLRKDTSKRYLGDEEDILMFLSSAEDYLTLNFLFLERKQSAEKILALIEDVFPSRLRRIFNVKEEVDKIFDMNFTFRNLRTFFSKSDPDKREFDLVNYFLEVMDRIFKERPIEKDFIIQFLIKRIRTQFARDEYFPQTVTDAISSFLFLLKLNLINVEVMDMEERLFDPVFKKFSPSFDHPVKRGLFLLGALTQMLLNTQYSQRGSTPFMKQLKGLKMEEKDFKGLLPKVVNKFQEYDSFDKGKQILAEESSYYLLLSGDNWKLSNDELNFYFTCGMNLYKELIPYIYPSSQAQE